MIMIMINHYGWNFFFGLPINQTNKQTDKKNVVNLPIHQHDDDDDEHCQITKLINRFE